MKTFVFLLSFLGLLSCNSTRFSEKGIRENKASPWHAANRSGDTLSYIPKSQFDYLEKDRDGIFFGNIYKIKQKKNRIVLKRQSIAKIAGFEFHE